MDCRCREITELHGDEAFEYAHGHLSRVAEEAGAWLYRCAVTGQEFVLDIPKEWDTGHGGRGRLRRFPFEKPPSRARVAE